MVAKLRLALLHKEAVQYPQEVVIPCPTRERSGLQRDLQDAPGSPVFDKKVPGLSLDIDEDFQASQCFTEVIRGYRLGVVEPAIMLVLNQLVKLLTPRSH